MSSWKLTTKRKKIQRHINSIIRAINRDIERDPLWLGRFYAHQRRIKYEISDDGSYCYAVVEVEFVDRKTGKTLTKWFHKEDFMGSTWKLWRTMNDFIVEWCKVWEEDPRPSIHNPWDYKKAR